MLGERLRTMKDLLYDLLPFIEQTVTFDGECDILLVFRVPLPESVARVFKEFTSGRFRNTTRASFPSKPVYTSVRPEDISRVAFAIRLGSTQPSCLQLSITWPRFYVWP